VLPELAPALAEDALRGIEHERARRRRTLVDRKNSAGQM